MRVALIGCGQMGLPMASALSVGGFDVRGYDIRPARDFGDFAPHMAPNLASLADRQVVQSVVRDIPQTEAVLFGPDGLLTHLPKLHTLVISSTVSPAYITSLPDRLPSHITIIDAPMSGAPIAAQERRLSFMLGGPDDTLDALMPLFQTQGKTLHRLGPLGTGMTAKVLNNLVAAASTLTTRTALAYANHLGTDAETLLQVLNTSSGQTWFSTNFQNIAFAREGYAPENTMGILEKDINSLLDALPDGTDTTLPQSLIATLKTLPPID